MGMIDVSEKEVISRVAVAEGTILLRTQTIDEIKCGTVKKGDPFKTAEAAALMGIKETFSRIPHCHPIPITSANLDFYMEPTSIKCKCMVKADYKTGVEMEALMGVTMALLTIWDMIKYLEKDDAGQYPSTMISGVRVIKKSKG